MRKLTHRKIFLFQALLSYNAVKLFAYTSEMFFLVISSAKGYHNMEIGK